MSRAQRVAAAVLACVAALVAAAPAVAADRDWLMMVVTRATDPARDAEFNAWYDDIDIPDVLEVPGYERARRGHRVEGAGLPVPAGDEGPYVALYDIDSPAIDRTIIEMLMATRKMEARGRSTDLLKVTERVYYRRRGTDVHGAAPVAAAARYLYVERADCCGSAGDDERFARAYDAAVARAVRGTPGVVGARRYELYRVLMIEPKTASRRLTIYEIDAATDAEATRIALAIPTRAGLPPPLRDAARLDASRLYRLLKDVRRR